MKKLGVVIWVILFVIFLGPNGSKDVLTANYHLFKPAMIAISLVAGSYFLYRLSLHIREQFVKEGIVAGLVWLAISLILDLIILVPFARMAMKDYVVAVGTHCFQTPMITVMTEWIQERKSIVNS